MVKFPCMINKFRVIQWAVDILWVSGASILMFIVSTKETGEKLTIEEMNVALLAWVIFATNLMLSVGLRVYRDYLAGKSTKFNAIVQISFSAVGGIFSILFAIKFYRNFL